MMQNDKISYGQMCTQCDDNNKAVYFCRECEEYICNDCTTAHRRTRLTKDHKLNKTDLTAAFKRTLCRNERHADKEVVLFCVDCKQNMCELCASEEHNQHVVAPLEKVFQEKHAYLAQLVGEIKQHDFKTLSKRMEDAGRLQTEKIASLKINIIGQFETYSEIIKERRNFLEAKIEQATENVTKRVKSNKDLMEKGQTMVSEADALLGETNPLTFLNSSHCLIEKLDEIQKKMPKMTEVCELRYNQACTTEDFNKIVQALGSIQEFGEAVREGENKALESNMGLRSVPSLSNESSRSEQLMEVLKSLTASQEGEKSLPQLDSRETQPGLNDETSTLGNVNKTNENNIQNLVSVVERNIPCGRRDMLRSSVVKDMVALRFQTWGLKGYWTVKDDHESVEMFSRTLEESEQCMQMLKETILEKTLELRKESAFIVESDKWQIITGKLKSKYPNQVEIEVIHRESKVAIYSTCTTILNDTCDAIRIFLRDNQIRLITLHYDEPIVTYIMRNKSRLEKIRNCFSQYCIEISNADNKSITLKGIGFGLGQAVRMTHGIALKYTKATEEDRFDSDHEGDDDEDELRFSDDEAVETDVVVQMNLNIGAEGKEAAIRALCFPGDDRMIYVLAGDITELPVEGLVNAADKTLKHNGGLAKALVQKGGRSIQEECTDYVQRNGSLPEGQVYCSGAGKLTCSVIIHAVGPKWIDGKSNEREKLYECVTGCLKNASRRKIASLAFPAISAGTYKFPLKVATVTIVNAVKDFLLKQPRCSIREIYLCDKAVDTVNEFADSLKECFADCDIVCSCGMRVIQQAEPARSDGKRSDVHKLLFI